MSRWTHLGYAQRIEFGADAIERVPELLGALGVRRVLLVTTAGRSASTDGRRLSRILGRVLASTFDAVRSHVPAPSVAEAVRQARRDAVDGLVSFGGGSCADLAKAVNYFTEQEAGIPALGWADRPQLPHVSIPTTYSGAELTPFFGMTDPRSGHKQGAGGATCAPAAAVYDPRLTLGTPARVSAETGCNALAHCVEILWSPTATPEATAVAQAGVARIGAALPRVVADPDDLDARTAMLAGAVLGGRCLQNGTMGVHHGLAQLIGGRTGIPHGLANAVILPHAIRFNAPVAPDAVALVGAALGSGTDPYDVADAVAAWVAGLGLPTRLGDCGVTEDDLAAVARSSQQNASVAANPRPVTEQDARAILEEAF